MKKTFRFDGHAGRRAGDRLPLTRARNCGNPFGIRGADLVLCRPAGNGLQRSTMLPRTTRGTGKSWSHWVISSSRPTAISLVKGRRWRATRHTDQQCCLCRHQRAGWGGRYPFGAADCRDPRQAPVNLTAVFDLSCQFSPLLREGGEGAILGRRFDLRRAGAELGLVAKVRRWPIRQPMRPSGRRGLS